MTEAMDPRKASGKHERILEASGLKKTFSGSDSGIAAVDDVSFYLEKGRSLALVGESGSGKSTIARLITGLEQADSGSIRFCGEEIVGMKPQRLRSLYRNVQMIFQDPTTSFNPRRKIGNEIIRGLVNFGMGRKEAQDKLEGLLAEVGLDKSYRNRYPSEISGGECQRAAIARAIALGPDLVICDECTAALDVNIQAQIIHLLKHLRDSAGLSLLFICHDLALIQKLCERTIVMLRGVVVEEGPTAKVIQDPCHPYTQLLVSSVFPIDSGGGWRIPEMPIQEDIVGEGCRFKARCGMRMDVCEGQAPPHCACEEGRSVMCWRYA